MKPRSAVKWLIAIAAATAIAAVSLSSATASSSRSGAQEPLFRFGLNHPQQASLDPGTNQGAPPGVNFWADYLMTFGNNGKLKSLLSTSVTQPGPAIYVYHLRHGMKFWDGNEVTAADVANSINYVRYPQFASAFAFNSVKSATVVDKYTVAVTLKHRDPSWPYVLAFEAPIFEKAFEQAHKGTFGQPGTLIQASGAYKVTSFDPTSGETLVANPSYWGPKPQFAKIQITFFNDEQSAALAMRSGSIDAYNATDPVAFQATAGGSVDVLSVPAAFSLGVFPMNWKVAPFTDIHIRRAVAYAINRVDIAKSFNPRAVPSDLFIPMAQLLTLGTQAQVNAALKIVPRYPYDVAKAKAEMAKSSKPNGFTFNNECVDYGKIPQECQVIAAELKAIGITMTNQVLDVGKWLSIILGPKTYPATITEYGWPNPDPSGMVGVIFSYVNGQPSNEDDANWAPPAFQQLMKQGLNETNKLKRLAIYAKVLKLINTDVPALALFDDTYSLALSNKFSWPSFNELSTLQVWTNYLTVK
jgi:peptide/nickel transport system substrate-binding protein